MEDCNEDAIVFLNFFMPPRERSEARGNIINVVTLQCGYVASIDMKSPLGINRINTKVM